MRVKCISNKGSLLPSAVLDEKSGFTTKTTFDLVVSKEYVVYGIVFFRGYPWYYLFDEGSSYYPRWNPAPLFEVVDSRLSRYWRYSYSPDSLRPPGELLITYREWVEDPYYYDKLTDGESKELDIFKAYKAKIDLEFPDPTVLPSATFLGDSWVMCTNCDESWQVDEKQGMTRCPGCQTIMHNPYYDDQEG